MEPPPTLAWERSHDWLIERTLHHRRRVSIRLPGRKPSVAELAAIRRSFPQFATAPPSQLLALFDGSSELEVGVFTLPEAARAEQQAKQAGLPVVARDASYVSDIPFDRTAGGVMIIEDDEMAAATIKAMIEAGVPVHETEDG